MMEKYSSRELLKALAEGLKGFKQGKNLDVTGETMIDVRNKAKTITEDLINAVGAKQARIKSESSIQKHFNDGKTSNDIDDIIGLRIIGDRDKNKSIQIADKVQSKLEANGITVGEKRLHDRTHYHGINIKATHDKTGVPIEVQIIPSKMSNAAQKMQHYVYKRTDHPNITDFDADVINGLAKFIIKKTGWKSLPDTM